MTKADGWVPVSIIRLSLLWLTKALATASISLSSQALQKAHLSFNRQETNRMFIKLCPVKYLQNIMLLIYSYYDQLNVSLLILICFSHKHCYTNIVFVKCFSSISQSPCSTSAAMWKSTSWHFRTFVRGIRDSCMRERSSRCGPDLSFSAEC